MVLVFLFSFLVGSQLVILLRCGLGRLLLVLLKRLIWFEVFCLWMVVEQFMSCLRFLKILWWLWLSWLKVLEWVSIFSGCLLMCFRLMWWVKLKSVVKGLFMLLILWFLVIKVIVLIFMFFSVFSVQISVLFIIVNIVLDWFMQGGIYGRFRVFLIFLKQIVSLFVRWILQFIMLFMNLIGWLVLSQVVQQFMIVQVVVWDLLKL